MLPSYIGKIKRLCSHPDKAGAGHSEHFTIMQNHIAVVEKRMHRWRELLAKLSLPQDCG
jgi:hypothetical protein